jgi:hypothetical protein
MLRPAVAWPAVASAGVASAGVASAGVALSGVALSAGRAVTGPLRSRELHKLTQGACDVSPRCVAGMAGASVRSADGPRPAVPPLRFWHVAAGMASSSGRSDGDVPPRRKCGHGKWATSLGDGIHPVASLTLQVRQSAWLSARFPTARAVAGCNVTGPLSELVKFPRTKGACDGARRGPAESRRRSPADQSGRKGAGPRTSGRVGRARGPVGS